MQAPDAKIEHGTKGPFDDFFCHKYQVWYRVEDCVYRSINRTFHGCVNCFQGHLNRRSCEKGIQPPEMLTAGPVAAIAGGAATAPRRKSTT